MTLRDLTQLKVGDILPIELSPQVPLCVENIPVFTGEFGIANGMNAVKITATHPPGTRRAYPSSGRPAMNDIDALEPTPAQFSSLQADEANGRT